MKDERPASILTMVYPVTAGSGGFLEEDEEEEEDVAEAGTMMGVAPKGADFDDFKEGC